MSVPLSEISLKTATVNPMNRQMLLSRSVYFVALLTCLAAMFVPSDAVFCQITLSGSVSSSYNGSDNPWATTGLIVGNGGIGEMTVTGGYVINNVGSGRIGFFSGAGSSAVISGVGSAWHNTSTMFAGNQTFGTLEITDGGTVTSLNGAIGAPAGGAAIVGGGQAGSTWTMQDGLTIGNLGPGVLTILGGGTVTTGGGFRLAIGVGSFGNGTLIVGDGNGTATLSISGGMDVAFGGIGIMNVNSGGIVTMTSSMAIGSQTGTANGTVTVGDGLGLAELSVSQLLSVGGASAIGKLLINAGGLVSTRGLLGGNAGSSISFDGGVLRITNTNSASNNLSILAGGGIIEVPNLLHNFTVSSNISGLGQLTKSGLGTLSLSGSNNLESLTVEEGTAALSGVGSMGSNCHIEIAEGAVFNVAAVTGGANFNGSRFVLSNGQLLSGTGSVVGAIAVESGGIVSPGSSTGQLTLSDTVLGPQGSYKFEINNALGTAGSTSSGWDLLNCSGILDVSATAESPFHIRIRSLTSDQLAGPMPQFNSSNAYSWTIAQASSIVNFDPDKFSLDTSGFGNDLNGGEFEVTLNGNTVRLNFVPGTQPAEVTASFVQHNNFSGIGTPVDFSKQLARESDGPQVLTYDNLINTARGINGIVFDIENLSDAANLSAEDFEFQMSPTGAFDAGANPPTNWQSAPAPSSISVTSGSADRVLIQWPDQSNMNRWLRVTIKSTANTGLAQPAVFYLGHLLGETTGPADNTFTVSFADISPIRADVGQTVDASGATDIDKNGTVSFADISAMRGNVGSQLTQIGVP